MPDTRHARHGYCSMSAINGALFRIAGVLLNSIAGGTAAICSSATATGTMST